MSFLVLAQLIIGCSSKPEQNAETLSQWLSESSNPMNDTFADSMSAPLVAAISSLVIFGRCTDGCDIRFNPKRIYHVAVERLLYASQTTSIPNEIIVRGNSYLAVPTVNSYISLVRETNPALGDDFFITSNVAAIGFKAENVATYRSAFATPVTYSLTSTTWIGCFVAHPLDKTCSVALLKRLNVVTHDQREEFERLRDYDFRFGLFWAAVVTRYPQARFPEHPCSKNQTVDVCTAVDIDAFKSRIDFHPSM